MEKYEKEKEDWIDDILDLAVWFDKQDIPKSINMGNGVIILNVPKFIERHITIAEMYNGIETFKIYLKRLRELKSKISETQQTKM